MSKNLMFEEVAGRKKSSKESAAGVSLLKVTMSSHIEEGSIKYNKEKIKEFKNEFKKVSVVPKEKIDIREVLECSGIVDETELYVPEVKSIGLKNNKHISEEDSFEIISFIKNHSITDTISQAQITKFFEMLNTEKIRMDMIIYGTWAYEEEKLFNKELYESRSKEIGIRGIYTCNKCGKDEVLLESKQTRSADEGTTIKIECVNCGNKWQEG